MRKRTHEVMFIMFFILGIILIVLQHNIIGYMLFGVSLGSIIGTSIDKEKEESEVKR